MQLPAAVIAVIILISGFVIFKNLPLNQPQPTVDKGYQAVMVEQTPTPTPTSTPAQKQSTKSTPKPSAKPSTSPSPSSSPSPTPTPSPTPKGSPQPGVYKLDPSPEYSIRMKAAQSGSGDSGYVMAALLLDSNGDVVPDQKDFNFVWSIDNSDLVWTSVGPTGGSGGCTGSSQIKPPCPNNNYEVSSKGQTGSTDIHVKAQKGGQTVAETQYHLELY